LYSRSAVLTSTIPIRKYPAAGGVVVNRSDGSVLVLLRAGRLGPRGYPEVRLPKGHIEPGEDPEQAALREVCEEAGLSKLEIIAGLGRESVEFDWQGVHFIRDETYYLLATTSTSKFDEPEGQFKRRWLDWESALSQLTYGAEREWLRRAQQAWNSRLEDIADQEPNKAYQYPKVEKEVPISDEEP
jgi:8-oxo-dGTP pyrophosphatase MutT (NUDIX family)